MVDATIRSMIGSWGNIVLDYYIANSLWINAILFLYALLVILSRRNFDASTRSLITGLRKQHGEQISKKSPGSILNILKKAVIPWNESLSSSPFPFITPPGSYRLYLKNKQTFQKFVPLEKLVDLLQRI